MVHCLQAGITVENYANLGAVGGFAQVTGRGLIPGLTAFPAGGSGATAASKFNVGLSAFRTTYRPGGFNPFFGPYWVVAVGESRLNGNFSMPAAVAHAVCSSKWAVGSATQGHRLLAPACVCSPMNHNLQQGRLGRGPAAPAGQDMCSHCACPLQSATLHRHVVHASAVAFSIATVILGSARHPAAGPTHCQLRMLAGPSANATLGYDWAIVSVGPPRTASNGKCRTGAAGNGPFSQGGGCEPLGPLALERWCHPSVYCSRHQREVLLPCIGVE